MRKKLSFGTRVFSYFYEALHINDMRWAFCHTFLPTLPSPTFFKPFDLAFSHLIWLLFLLSSRDSNSNGGIPLSVYCHHPCVSFLPLSHFPPISCLPCHCHHILPLTILGWLLILWVRDYSHAVNWQLDLLSCAKQHLILCDICKNPGLCQGHKWYKCVIVEAPYQHGIVHTSTTNIWKKYLRWFICCGWAASSISSCHYHRHNLSKSGKLSAKLLGHSYYKQLQMISWCNGFEAPDPHQMAPTHIHCKLIQGVWDHWYAVDW